MSFLSFGATPALLTSTLSLPKCFLTCSIIFFLSTVNETSPWQYRTSAPALRNSCKASVTTFSSLTPFTARSKPFCADVLQFQNQCPCSLLLLAQLFS